MIMMSLSSSTQDCHRRRLFALCVFVCVALPGTLAAQQGDALTLSVTPVLYEMSAEPSQRWSSSLRVVNVNDFDLTVYPEVVNFAPQGEGGRGAFVPIEATDRRGATLAEWVDLEAEPVTIEREQSVEIPFTVTVPPDAAPGGHFAAFLISTRPPDDAEGPRVQTAQAITSLFFLRVAGDIIEDGRIREFRPTARVLGQPEATFALRFENRGNVHLQPQGEITITNMWGQERGVIPINQGSRFGNVLPDSIRRFTYTWSGTWSIADIGRYEAIATLAYGDSERQFTSAGTHFWVIPIMPLLYILGGLAAIVWIILTAIKLYIRRMLTLSGVDTSRPRERVRPTDVRDLRIDRYARVGAPVSAGVQDLRVRMSTAEAGIAKLRALGSFILAYRLFFIFAVLIAAAVAAVVWFIQSAGTPSRPYEVTISDPDANVRLSGEDVIYRERYGTERESLPAPATSSPEIAVVNRSGEAGRGADVRFALESAGYEVTTLTATERRDSGTVVVHTPETVTTALTIADVVGDALLSPVAGGAAGYTEPIVVFIGRDHTDR